MLPLLQQERERIPRRESGFQSIVAQHLPLLIISRKKSSTIFEQFADRQTNQLDKAITRGCTNHFNHRFPWTHRQTQIGPSALPGPQSGQ